MQLHNFFEKQLSVFFTLIDLSRYYSVHQLIHYFVHKSIEIQLPKNK